VRTIDTRSIPNSKWRTRYLTKTEFNALLRSAAPHLRPIIELAVETGMRLGEIEVRLAASLDKLIEPMKGDRTDLLNGFLCLEIPFTFVGG
jgi:hypothetical protein